MTILSDAMKDAGAIEPTKFFVSHVPWRGGYQVFITAGMGPEGRQYCSVTSIEVKKLKPGNVSEPAWEMSEEQAQSLLDSLWHTGLRPRDEMLREGALGATQAHLADMQSIAMRSVEYLLNPPPAITKEPNHEDKG